MRAEPSAELIALLERLRLATPAQVRAEHARVTRLARDLPPFDSVWVDALAQARLLTLFQAAEINAGRGDELRLGPYVLFQRLAPAAAWQDYLARDYETSILVRLTVFSVDPRDELDVRRKIDRLVAATAELESPHLAPATRCGVERGQCWIACRHDEGPSAASWLVEHGRLAPEVVLEIARQMTATLAGLEAAGVCHGDLAAGQLWLHSAGRALLHLPGLRGIVRPEEGYAHTELPPEAYDYLAPERVERGTPPNAASDLFACGCLWWHLLAGRPPLAGGNGLAKMKSAQAARIDDIARIAPDTPRPLALAIAATTHREVARRPESFGRLAAMLGPSTRQGRVALSASLAKSAGPRVRARTLVAATQWSEHAPIAVAAVAGCLATLAVVTWPQWSKSLAWPGATAASVTRSNAATPQAPLRRAEQPPELVSLDGKGAKIGSGANTSAPSTVQPVSAQAPVQVAGGATGDAVLLPTDRPLAIAEFQLRAGQTVRGIDGRRALVVAPPTGLTVNVEDVRFEGVDFVIAPSAGGGQDAPLPAMIEIRAWKCRFTNCSFQATGENAAAVALRWNPHAAAVRDTVELSTGLLQVENGVFARLDAAIDQQASAALSIELSNVLCLGPGSLVRLRQFPTAEEPVIVALSRVTLRDARALVECHHETAPPYGRLAVQASDCVLHPDARGAVLLFSGTGDLELLYAAMAWTGQGSVLSPDARMIGWRPPRATQSVTISDRDLNVAGLVRNDADFAGQTDEGPAASRIVRWQVPLHSTDPPGIEEAGLALPTRSQFGAAAPAERANLTKPSS